MFSFSSKLYEGHEPVRVLGSCSCIVPSFPCGSDGAREALLTPASFALEPFSASEHGLARVAGSTDSRFFRDPRYSMISGLIDLYLHVISLFSGNW